MPKAKYYRRPDGLYETKRTIRGKRVAFRGRTCAEVDKKILEYNVNVSRGRKFPVVADEWYEAVESTVSHNTHRTYSFALRRVKEYFTCHVGEIRPLDIKRYITEFEGKGYALNTVQIELSVIKQIMSYAVMQGDIDLSPAAEVKHGKHLPKKKRNALTEEQEMMVEAFRGEDWLLGVMLLYTGARRGELLAMNWQDIDREKGVIRINKKLNYGYGNKPVLETFLKNRNKENNDGTSRIVPLLAPLAELLPRNRIGRIFTDENGDYLSGSQVTARWRSYCRAVGLTEWGYDENGNPQETFPITPHCFRHSFTTICYEAGVDAKTTAAFIGDTEQVTQQVYTELRARHHVNSAERVNAYLELRSAEREEVAE